MVELSGCSASAACSCAAAGLARRSSVLTCAAVLAAHIHSHPAYCSHPLLLLLAAWARRDCHKAAIPLHAGPPHTFTESPVAPTDILLLRPGNEAAANGCTDLGKLPYRARMPSRASSSSLALSSSSASLCGSAPPAAPFASLTPPLFFLGLFFFLLLTLEASSFLTSSSSTCNSEAAAFRHNQNQFS